MWFFIGLAIGLALGYTIKAIGVKVIVKDLKAEVERLRNKAN